MLICKDKFYFEGSHSISIRDKIAHKLCSNLLIHREFSSGITSRLIITKESIYTENPKIAKIFRGIGLADELRSGVRNITNYSEVYSGEEPIFEEGDIFKATVPLVKAIDKNKFKNSKLIKNKKTNLSSTDNKA